MVREIILDDTSIHVESFKEDKDGNLKRICIEFKVTSEDYHAITTLLYKGTFDIEVPVREIMFTGDIQEYATSITNLYKKGQVGDFRLCLREVSG